MSHARPRSLLLRLMVVAALAATSNLALGCVRHYTMPAPNEPHAIVKLRVSYHARAGTGLHHGLVINGEAIDVPTGTIELDGTTTHALRVREEPTGWGFSSVFYHIEMRSRLVTEYRTQTYGCTTGYGRTQRHSTCTRRVPHRVMRTVATEVPDMSCATNAAQMPRNGHVYVLQYDFVGQGQCSLRCYEQIRDAVGGFSVAPCEPPPMAPR